MFKGSLENLSPILFLSKRVNLDIASLVLINLCPPEFEVVLSYLLVLCFLFASCLLPGIGRYQVRLKQISFLGFKKERVSNGMQGCNLIEFHSDALVFT